MATGFLCTGARIFERFADKLRITLWDMSAQRTEM
jgi:hypothetical protein